MSQAPTQEDGPDEKATAYYRNTRRDIAALLPLRPVKLLDIGCAEGRFGAHVLERNAGSEVWGIEVMPDVAARAAARLTHVLCGPIEELLGDLPEAHFDFITFNDVLEHLTDPWSVLRSMKSKLAADGLLIASIPNIRYFAVLRSLLLDADFEYVSEGVLDRTHLRFFTKKSMRRLFSESGYSVTQVDGLNWEPFPIWLRIANRLLRRSFDDMHFVQFAIQGKHASA